MLGDDVDIMVRISLHYDNLFYKVSYLEIKYFFFQDLARKTEGYTGADIKALVLSAESRARMNREIETCLEDLIQKFNN